MAIKGSLREASLADVCQLLALGAKTGSLSVADGSRFGQIFFDRGRITYARIVNRRDRLGDLLVRDGLLNQEALDEVLRLQAREPDVRIGELLVKHDYITRADLTYYIRLQIEEAIYHLFTWSRGNFFFEADARPDPGDVVASLHPESLLLEAARRVDEWGLIEKKVPSFDLVFDVDRTRLQQSGVALTSEQQQIVPLFDGTRTVLDVVHRSGLDEFAVGKALFGLIQAGFAQQVGRRTDDTVKGREAELQERRNLGIAFYRTGMMDDARREFERVLDLDGTDFPTRYHLALIALREGRHRNAVRQLRVLIDERGPHWGCFVNMALALRLLGRPAEALLALEQADALRPDSSAARLARGMTHMTAHAFGPALQALQEYHALLRPEQQPAAEYFYYRALGLAVQRQHAEAERVVGEGLDLHRGSAPLLVLQGALSERRGSLDEADRAYRQAIDEDAALAQAHKNLGDVCYRRGAHEEALQFYLRAADLAPDLGDDLFAKLGNLLYKTRKMAAAVEYWQKALQLNPDNAIVRNNLEIVAHASR